MKPISLKHVLFFAVLSVMLALAACGGKKPIKDLQKYVANLEQNVVVPKKQLKLVDLTPPTPIKYTPNKTRSPFGGANYNSMSLTHPLEGFPLSILRFKGVVISGNQMTGYLLTPDSKLYPVKIGDIIGDHYGKILNIYPDRIEVQEQITEPGKAPTQRIVTLQLKDES